jgi:hypothetical protein
MQVMLDVKDKMNPNSLTSMIMWRFHTSLHVVEGFIFVNLIIFYAKVEFPETIFVVTVNS